MFSFVADPTLSLTNRADESSRDSSLQKTATLNHWPVKKVGGRRPYQLSRSVTF